MQTDVQTDAATSEGAVPAPATGATDAVARAGVGDIARFYAGRCVLVTGASGFMGKALVEKLVRQCPGLDTVFVLLRPRRDCPVEERLRRLLATPAFAALRRGRPEALSKVVAVAGDVTSAGLGLVTSDRARLSESVSVVFHVAANVRFNEHLRRAFDVNVLGTRAVLQFCRQVRKLEALVYVSTAYSHCPRQHVDEVVYPAPFTADALQALLGDDAQVERDTPRLLGVYPNSYTLTKAVAECLVVEEGKGLPVVIIRPSIVSPAWREPLPGWVDNINGPVGPWVAIGMGTMSCVFGDPSKVADLVPVDVCVNLMIATAWDRRAAPSSGVVVYHCVSGGSNAVTWGECTALWVASVRERPYARTLGYPTASFTQSRLVHGVRTAAEKALPALVLDALPRLAGRSSSGLAALVSRQRRMMRPLDFFTSRQWSFADGNVRALWSRMGGADRAAFPFDLSGLDWPRYMRGVLLGSKKFLLGEEDVRMRLQRLYAFDRFFVAAMLPLLLLATRPMFSNL